MFLSRKALIKENGLLPSEVDMLRKRLAELEEKQREVPENCTPGEWCKACGNAYVADLPSHFGCVKVATCTLDRCAEFIPSGYLSSRQQLRNDRKEP